MSSIESRCPEDFREAVYEVVRQIPAGRVLSYGKIAELTGWPRRARHVGRVLRETPASLRLPCHRVVNSAGRIAPSWPEQRTLLLSEGVSFRSEQCVNMALSAWRVEELI